MCELKRECILALSVSLLVSLSLEAEREHRHACARSHLQPHVQTQQGSLHGTAASSRTGFVDRTRVGAVSVRVPVGCAGLMATMTKVTA